MEIDPSYTIDKLRLWASLRYYSKQFANLTNALYFQPHWETFAGASYKCNKNVELGLSITNLFNQTGAKGTISGAELITDPTPYYNQPRVGAYIIPFTTQFSVTLNF
jgi:outer membrane receptor for ferrienterochelin and colicin